MVFCGILVAWLSRYVFPRSIIYQHSKYGCSLWNLFPQAVAGLQYTKRRPGLFCILPGSPPSSRQQIFPAPCPFERSRCRVVPPEPAEPSAADAGGRTRQLAEVLCGAQPCGVDARFRNKINNFTNDSFCVVLVSVLCWFLIPIHISCSWFLWSRCPFPQEN